MGVGCGVWSVGSRVLSKYGSGSGSGSGSEESRENPKIRGQCSDPESQGANDPFRLRSKAAAPRAKGRREEKRREEIEP